MHLCIFLSGVALFLFFVLFLFFNLELTFCRLQIRVFFIRQSKVIARLLWFSHAIAMVLVCFLIGAKSFE